MRHGFFRCNESPFQTTSARRRTATANIVGSHLKILAAAGGWGRVFDAPAREVIMSYELIRPPCPLNFKTLSKRQLDEYFDWYVSIIPVRVDELAGAVKDSRGFESWQPFNSPDSLNELGEWFGTQVETRRRTQAEIDSIKRELNFEMDVPSVELTDRTISLAMDLGMYVSQVFFQNHPTLRWSRPLGSKKSIDYGQPVLVPFGRLTFNPTHMMTVMAYGFARNAKKPDALREVYDIWAKKVGD